MKDQPATLSWLTGLGGACLVLYGLRRSGRWRVVTAAVATGLAYRLLLGPQPG